MSKHYRGWSRHRDPEHFWLWIGAGCPQPWAFWRGRDEVDGVWLGIAIGGAIVVAVLFLADRWDWL